MTNYMKEGIHTGEFVVSVSNGRLSFDTVTLDGGQSLSAGAVLGAVTATGRYKAYDPAATDGTETASAILYDNTETEAGKPQRVGVVSRLAEVQASALQWSDGVDETAKAAAIADLEASFIVVR